MERDMVEKLRGVFAPIATPFKADEDLDLAALTHNVTLYENTRLRGCLVLGSNGECKSLDDAEKMKVLETVLGHLGGHLTVTVGVMYETCRHAEQFVRRLADLGADFALAQSPSYFKKLMTDDTLYAYFSSLADSAPIPLLLYNCPGFNGITLSLDLLERLSEHPNIVGMKDSTPGCDLEIMRLNRDGFHVMAGSVTKLRGFVDGGSVGGTVSLANYAPALAVELYENLVQQDAAKSVNLDRDVVAMNKCISGNYGVPGVKAAMDLMGFKGGIPRRPLRPLNRDQIETVRSALVEAGVLR